MGPKYALTSVVIWKFEKKFNSSSPSPMADLFALEFPALDSLVQAPG